MLRHETRRVIADAAGLRELIGDRYRSAAAHHPERGDEEQEEARVRPAPGMDNCGSCGRYDCRGNATLPTTSGNVLRMNRRQALAVLVAGLATPAVTRAQGYPTKPIRVGRRPDSPRCSSPSAAATKS
jgi:hypothetical protein